MLLVDQKVCFRVEKRTDKLIGRSEVVKTAQRLCVLHPGIMGIKGDKIRNAHIAQFLNGVSAVKGFPAVSLMLAPLVQKGHDHIDSVCFSVDSGNNTF